MTIACIIFFFLKIMRLYFCISLVLNFTFKKRKKNIICLHVLLWLFSVLLIPLQTIPNEECRHVRNEDQPEREAEGEGERSRRSLSTCEIPA